MATFAAIAWTAPLKEKIRTIGLTESPVKCLRYRVLIGCDLHGRNRLNSCRRAARAEKILPLQHEIRELKRQG